MSDDKPSPFLEKPSFGVPPENKPNVPPGKEHEFLPLLDMMRERPFEWAKIAEYKGSNRKKTLAEARAARARLWRYLILRCPLEDWKLSTRMTPDTWCDREMWAQFRGTMTPEEAMKLAAIRRNAYSSKVQNGADKKQRREARAYERAVLADRENRLRQRTVE